MVAVGQRKVDKFVTGALCRLYVGQKKNVELRSPVLWCNQKTREIGSIDGEPWC